MNTELKDMKSPSSELVALDFPLLNSWGYNFVFYFFLLTFLVALVGSTINDHGEVLSRTNLFLLTGIAFLLFNNWIARQYADYICITSSTLEIHKNNKTLMVDWNNVIGVKYMVQISGWVNIWVKSRENEKNKTLFFCILPSQSPIEKPNKFDVLISEFKKRAPTKTFLHVW